MQLWELTALRLYSCGNIELWDCTAVGLKSQLSDGRGNIRAVRLPGCGNILQPILWNWRPAREGTRRLDSQFHSAWFDAVVYQRQHSTAQWVPFVLKLSKTTFCQMHRLASTLLMISCCRVTKKSNTPRYASSTHSLLKTNSFEPTNSDPYYEQSPLGLSLEGSGLPTIQRFQPIKNSPLTFLKKILKRGRHVYFTS